MRARNIKPGFFKNEDLADCDPLARILFAGLWCYCDREGRFEWRPKRIKIEILPYDNCDIEKLLSQLVKIGLIEKYKVGEEYYGNIINFLKHQSPHKQEKPSEIPPLENIEKITEQVEKITEQVGLNPESLNPESLNPESLNPVKKPELFSKDSDPIKLSELLFELILENDPKAKEPNYQKWAEHIDKLNRLDSRPYDEIEEVIRWTQKDDFEKANVLSTAKIRKRYPQLRLKWKGGKIENRRGAGETRASPKREENNMGHENIEQDPWPVDVE